MKKLLFLIPLIIGFSVIHAESFSGKVVWDNYSEHTIHTFTTTQNGDVTLTLTREPVFNFTLYVRDSADHAWLTSWERGSRDESPDVTGNYVIRGLGEGTYTVSIEVGWYYAAEGSYSGFTTLTPHSVENDSENNDTIHEANELPLDTTETGYLSYPEQGVVDNADWYVVTTDAQGDLRVEVTTSGTNDNTGNSIRDSDGNLILNATSPDHGVSIVDSDKATVLSYSSQSEGTDATYVVSDLSPGRYYIGLKGGGRASNRLYWGSYTVKASLVRDERTPSGVSFTDLYGEVYVIPADNPDDFYFAELDSVLYMGDIVETRGDSGAILSLRDMTTFVMRENSMLTLVRESEDQTTIGLLTGAVFTNFKRMFKDGSLDIELSQAVAGIKGTSLILSDDGTTSSVMVINGSVEVTPDSGSPLLLAAGEKVTVEGVQVNTETAVDLSEELEQFGSQEKQWIEDILAAASDDHGDSLEEATTVALGASEPGHLDEGDMDYFRVDVTGPGTLTVYSEGDTDTHGSLMDASGSLLADNDDRETDLNFSIDYSIQTAGSYYVKVRSYDSETSGDYEFSSSFTPSDSGADSWHIDAVDLGDGWCWYGWFKGFKPEGENWIYHGRHGWLYVLADDTNRMFLWDGALGRWMFTSESVYPWMYAYGPNEGWVFFFEGGRPGSRYFKRGGSGQVVSEQELGL